MQQAPTILTILLGLSALLAAYLAAWASLHSKIPAAKEFFWMLLAVAIYSLGYAFEISRVDLAGMLTAIRFEYIGLSFIPTMMLLFVLHFSRKKPLPFYVISILLLFPLTTLIIVYTQQYHNLFYIDPHINTESFFPALDFERGIWYKINFAHLLISSIIGVMLLSINSIRTNKKQKKQAIAIAIASALPILGSILYILDLIPGNLDPGPFCLVLTSIIFAIALFKLGLFELIPAARELAVDSIRDGFLVIDNRGRLQDLNQAARKLPGASELELGQTLPKDNPLVTHLCALLNGEKDRLEFTVDFPDNGLNHYSAKAYPITSKISRIEGIAILISDITETISLMNKLTYQASTDELTGILNRRHLMKFGTQEIKKTHRTKSPLGIILIDLDHFKQINDQFGHAIGDEVLKNVAKSFRKALRDVDILGRYGGEEFVVFLPNANTTTTIQIAKRLQQQLGQMSLTINNDILQVTASFGVHSVYPDDNTSIDELLIIADQALYQAKANGRDQIATSRASTQTPPQD